MKKIITFSFILFCFSISYAQDFKKSLPRVGEAHYHCISSDRPEMYQMNKSSNMWNFNFMNSYFCIEEKFEAARNGKYFSKFPKADLVLKSVNGAEEYFYNRKASFYSHGKVMEVSFLKSNKLFITYTPYKKIYKSDVEADKSTTNVFELESKISLADFIKPLDIFHEMADSILIEIKVNEKAGITDDGTLLYNSSSRHSQKQEYLITTNTKIKYKNKNGNVWKEDLSLSLENFPVYLSEIFSFPEKRVVFLSNEYKGATLTYDIKDDNVININFQDEELSPSSLNLSVNDNNVLMLPNPSFGESTIYFLNLPIDTYQLVVSNLVGKKVLTKKITKEMGKEINIDFSSLRKGTYIYNIINSKGEKITTKRLVITSI